VIEERVLRYVYLAWFIISIANSSAAEPAQTEQAQRDAWTNYYARQLSRYNFNLESDPDMSLTVDPKAKLRWANPVRMGRTHGDLFIWTYRGRAALVGTIFSYDVPDEAEPSQRRVAHGFHSLSTETIVGTRDGEPLPEIPGPGVQFQLIKGAPTPAATRPLRLAQMRMLFKEFEASIRDTGVTQPLRPLPQPVYRYETKQMDEDGAVFAYVAGTDPELIMVLESRATDDGPKWHFAAGRYANVPLELKHRGATVWEFDGPASHKGGYFSQHDVDLQPLVPAVDGGSDAGEQQ
jgi:hypothetical protein